MSCVYAPRGSQSGLYLFRSVIAASKFAHRLSDEALQFGHILRSRPPNDKTHRPSDPVSETVNSRAFALFLSRTDKRSPSSSIASTPSKSAGILRRKAKYFFDIFWPASIYSNRGRSQIFPFFVRIGKG